MISHINQLSGLAAIIYWADLFARALNSLFGCDFSSQVSLTNFFPFSLSLYSQVKVTVMDKNDSPPTFRDLPQSYMVSEDLGTGQLVATIKASDPDTIGKLEYSLVSGDDGKFLLEKYQGTLKLRDTLDRETKDLYKLLIRVTDGVQYTETTIAIQVCSISDSLEFIDRKRQVNSR